MLLTTLTGTIDPATGLPKPGDVFEYRQTNGNTGDEDTIIRVKLQGNIQVELIGANVSRLTNEISLGNLPGVRTGGSVTGPLFGGLGGEGNSILTIGDILNPSPGGLNIRGLAATSGNAIYGFNSRPNVTQFDPVLGQFVTGTATDVLLLTLPPGSPPAGTVTATVIGTLFAPNGAGGADLPATVTAADFSPTGELFFTAITSTGFTRLFSIDPSVANAGTPADEVAQSLFTAPNFLLPPPVTAPGGGQQAQTIDAIAFNTTGNLYGVINGGGQGGGQGGATLILINPNAGSFVAIGNLTPQGQQGGGQQVGGITGIDFNAQNDLIAITSDADFDSDENVLLINETNATFVNLGSFDTQGGSALAFVPGLIDPFTGSSSGAFIGVDVNSDELFFVNTADRLPAQTLWNVFVTGGDITGEIVIGFVDDFPPQPPPPNPYSIRPFDGDIGSVRFFNTQGGQALTVGAPGGSGQALIGALTFDIIDNTSDEERNPFGPQPLPAEIDFGTLPQGIDTLPSGVQVADGVDLGKFMLAGTLIGQVEARRNVDFFYAGWLLTGQTNTVGPSGFSIGMGQSEGAPQVPDNFKVDGDLRSLYVRGPIGTGSGAGIQNPATLTGFDLQVGGTLGNVRSFENAFYGKVEVANLDDRGRAFQIQRNQIESEFHNGDMTSGFESFNFGPSFSENANVSGEGNANAFMYNDSYDTAEYLGSITSEELNGRTGVVRVNGVLQKTPVLQDDADYYAISLMAGQTVRVRVREQVTTIPDIITDINGDGVIDADDFAGLIEGGAEEPNPLGLISLGVFDPDGRLIATDYNNVDPLLTNQQYFTFKADRPGIYRFAVASVGDTAYGGGVGTFTITPYTLTALAVGNVALGGIVAQSTIYDLADFANDEAGFRVFRGDFGAVKSIGGAFVSDSLLSVNAENGNLRTIDAVTIGDVSPSISPRFAPIIDVPRGSVGLVRASGAALALNSQVLASTLSPVGGDYQLIDGPAATVHVQLRANRAVGVIRGANMSAFATPSVIEVNADDSGRDGVIDLIDVTGDLGSIEAGGPQITTNTGGNVRYIRVGGVPFRDSFFGNPQAEITNGVSGESVSIRDDSGSQIRFTSAGTAIRNPFFDPAFPNAGIPQFIGSRMSFVTYPIRGSGGSVVINATSESGMSIDVQDGPAEIGRVEIAGLGRAVLNGTIQADPSTDAANLDGVQVVANDVVDDPDSPTGTRQSLVLDPRELTADTVPIDFARMDPDDFFLRITGSGLVDVLNVVAINNGAHENLDIDGNVEALPLGDSDAARPTALGNPVSISNGTGGELVNVVAATVGELSSRGNLGFARSTTGTVVEGIAPLTVGAAIDRGPGGRGSRAPVGATAVGLQQPFLNLREGIAINGNVMSLRAGKAIGNVVINGGSVDEVVANSDGENVPDEFEGINGTVYAAVGGTAITSLPGRVNRVRIGEGILPSGSGNFQQAGILAEGVIGSVTGENADIRGDIIALNTYRVLTQTTVIEIVNGQQTITRTIVNPSHTPIGRVVLTGGSIINADILATSTTGDSREFVGLVGPEFVTNENFLQPDFEIGIVKIIGNGGIIGTRFAGADIDSIVVENSGFGIFTSRVDTTGEGTLSRLVTGGYGLRNLDILAARVGELTANGDGTSLSTNAVSSQVRYSEVAEDDAQLGPVDPFFGIESNELTDIHRNLGTSSVQGEISGVTDTGIIESVSAAGQRDLRSVRAWQIRGQSRLDFGNSVGTLDVRDIINGLEMTTGTLKKFALNRDAFALTVTVAGRVKRIDIGGSLAGNSVIRTSGEGGQFDTVNIKGNLVGNINSSRSIKSINIGGDFTGNVSVNSGGTALKTLKVGGAFVGGSLDIVGNVGTIQSAGSLGSLGDTLSVNGNVSKIMVGGDLRANVRVTGNLKTLQVKGSIVDGGIEDGLVIDVSNTLTSLVVGGDIQPGVKINANMIKKQKVGGQSLGEFTIAQ